MSTWIPKVVSDAVGGLPDRLFVAAGRALRETSHKDLETYMQSLAFYERYLPRGLDRLVLLPTSVTTRAQSIVERYPQGVLERIEIVSSHVPSNPFVEGEYRAFSRSDAFPLYLYRHESGQPRPVVLCLHGFLMGERDAAERMFRAKKLFDKGVDVAFFPFPQQGERSPAWHQQRLLAPHNLPLSIEMLTQGIEDIQSVLLALRQFGYDRVGAIAASMGGLLGSLYSTLRSELSFLFLVVPAVDLHPMLAPDGACFRFTVPGYMKVLSERVIDLVTPGEYAPKLDANRIQVVFHGGDKLVDAALVRRWIQQWNLDRVVEVPGGHWWYFDSSARSRAWYGWLNEVGFTS